MSHKVHIISSDSPLYDLEHSRHLVMPYGLMADCGERIARPVMACCWDETAMGAMLDFPPSVCGKCRAASDQKHAKYVYGVSGK